MQNNNNIVIKKDQYIKINKDDEVKVIRQGKNYIEIIKTTAKNYKCGIKKISRDKYIVKATGEVKKFKEVIEKTRKSLKRSMQNLRIIIRENFDSSDKRQLFLTLTYKENMKDTKKLMNDMKKFIRKLRKKYSQCKLEYIAIAEPQGRGAWHLHILLKDTNENNKVLYIDNKELEKIWGNGYTDVQALKSDDVGSYYVSYFTDLLDNNKKREKYKRLCYYTKNFKFYRTSEGIERPKSEIKLYKDIEKELLDKELKYKVNYTVTSNDKIINTITKEVWKRENKK